MAETPITASGAGTHDAWKQFSCLLFDTPASQSLEALQGKLEEASSTHQAKPGGAQVLVDAGTLAHAIEDYCSQFQEQLKTQAKFFRALLAHLEAIYSEPPDAALLAQIRSQFSGAYPSDPVLVQTMLSRYLMSLKESYCAKKEANELLIASLHDRIQMLEQSNSAAESVPTEAAPPPAIVADPCTGLPAKPEAEAVLRRVAGSSQHFIAAFYVHRMSLINARFGEDVGNEILLYCSQHIATNLIRPTDLLFRWSGPVFVAVLEREESAPVVAGEVRRLVSAPLSRFFDNSSRTMYLPVRLTAETLPAVSQDYTAFVEQIAQFIHAASRVG